MATRPSISSWKILGVTSLYKTIEGGLSKIFLHRERWRRPCERRMQEDTSVHAWAACAVMRACEEKVGLGALEVPGRCNGSKASHAVEEASVTSKGHSQDEGGWK